MRRRQFIAVLSGAALWPCSARAQRAERVRRIGVNVPLPLLGRADAVIE